MKLLKKFEIKILFLQKLIFSGQKKKPIKKIALKKETKIKSFE
tara:strand:- start:25 stop:153 length:129 start_codon:yes stop_codon:yes gene_type:complete